MKRKFFIILISFLILGVISFNLSLNYNLQGKKYSTLTLANIMALAYGENGEGEGGFDPETGAGITNQKECAENLGYWNMAMVCIQVGVSTVTCEYSGKISILGFSFEGGYKKGNKYEIAWENWSCQNSSGNCCIASKQGIRLKDNGL